MYLTISRKADRLEKSFSKYLSVFLPDIKYIPRGKTSLNKLFKSAIYLGHTFFLLVTKKERDSLLLLVYKRKENEFYPDKEITFKILELNHLLSYKEINKLKNENDFVDKDKVFYFVVLW